MKKRIHIGGLVVVLMMSFSGVLQAADDAELTRDMTAVIALLGLPCGKVVRVVKQDDKGQIASCENGNRYRIFLNAEGRVIAEKQ